MEDAMSEFPEGDRELFRSHFIRPDQLADRASPRPDVDDGAALVEPVDKETDGLWLNVRVGDGEWASAQERGRLPTERTRQGRIADAPPPTDSSERPAYSDPVADNMDPTAPDSPESCF
jgi:hypothetical protein